MMLLKYILLLAVMGVTSFAQASDVIQINTVVKEAGKQYIISYCPDSTCDLMTFKKKHFDRAQASNLFSLYLINFSGYVYLEDLAKKETVQKVSEYLISELKNDKCLGKVSLKKLACALQDYESKKWIELRQSRADEKVNKEQVIKLRQNEAFARAL